MKSKNKAKPKSNKKKKIIILLVTLLVIAIATGGYLYYRKSVKATNAEEAEKIRLEEERIEIKDSIELETSSKIPEILDFVSKKGNLSDDLSIEYINVEDIEDKSLQSVILYFDEDNNEVNKEEALDESEELNKKFTLEEHLTGIGEYQVVITDNSSGLTYESKLSVIDTIAPSLTLKEKVEISEGESVKIEDFISSCSDASRVSCEYRYVTKDDEGNFSETKDLDLSVGEHTIIIQAYDLKNNTVESEAKLVIQKKKETKPTTSTSNSNKNTTSNKGTSSSSSNKNTNNSTSKPSTNNNTNNNSSNNNTNTQKPATSSDTCTPSVMLPTGKRLSGSEIIYYHRFSSPVSFQEADAWEDANPVMPILQDESKHRMKRIKTPNGTFGYSGRTFGGYYQASCGVLVYGIVLYIEYAPPTWINAEHTDYQNMKVQGSAYLDSNQSPHWIYKNFEAGWWPNQFKPGYVDEAAEEVNTGDKNPR